MSTLIYFNPFPRPTGGLTRWFSCLPVEFGAGLSCPTVPPAGEYRCLHTDSAFAGFYSIREKLYGILVYSYMSQQCVKSSLHCFLFICVPYSCQQGNSREFTLMSLYFLLSSFVHNFHHFFWPTCNYDNFVNK